VRINDFPTPSGWFMTRATLGRVGPFDESYRFHLDNEWLGRLTDAGIVRAHLVESTAPVDLNEMVQVRPWLAQLIELSRASVRIMRHASPYPLVNRLVHTQSSLAQIRPNTPSHDRSDGEYKRLEERYGRIPW
jgi:hypothetical protein